MTDNEIIKNLKNSDKPIYIYGDMNTARIVHRFLVSKGIKPIAFVVDAFAYQGEKVMEGIPVMCIDDIEGIDRSNIVIGFDSVEKTKALFSLSRYLVYNIWHLITPCCFVDWSNDFYEKHKSELTEFRNSLADLKSKKVFDALINAYNGGEIFPLLLLADPIQYFNELTFSPNTENDVFVDCGAFDGDSVKKYVEFTDSRYKKIFAMEPLVENVSLLRKNTKDIKSLHIIEYGAWSYNTSLSFNADTSASAISETGKQQIKVTAIDNIVKDEDVTFIKMDIEGSEYEGLLGAKNTIERCYPKLAICVYHKSDDLIRIPNLIKSFNGADVYNFYLRHHSNRLSETVLYAIPRKKV